MSLSSALIATVALLIIVVAVVVVVVVAVVVVVVIVVVVGRPDSTVLGRMANPLAVTALGWTRNFMIVITLGTQRFRPDVWFPVTIACSVGLACVLPHILLVLIVLGKIIILSFPFCLTFNIGLGLIIHQLSCKLDSLLHS
ncbi:hypothetical protein Tco_0399077, partial [Tanacetum coccineum]